MALIFLSVRALEVTPYANPIAEMAVSTPAIIASMALLARGNWQAGGGGVGA